MLPHRVILHDLDGETRLVIGARVFTGKAIAESVQAHSHYSVVQIVVEELTPLHEHQTEAAVFGDLLG